MKSLLERIESNLLHRCGVRPGQKIAVAVSGGVDSMVLLHLLQQLSGAQGWRLLAVHFNHQLRGRESDADERLVKGQAAELGIPCVCGGGDVRARARERSISIEMAARELRQAFLTETCRRRRIPVLALAHHADDRIETFFLRLFRGAGGEGLAGLRWHSLPASGASPCRVRPLLDVHKLELRRFAREQGVTFREDRTNRDAAVPRNRIRRELLPFLRQFAPQIDETLPRALEIVTAEADFAESAAVRWLGQARRSAFARLPLAVQRRVIQRQLLELGVTPDFALIELLRRSPEQTVSAASGRLLVCGRDGSIRGASAPLTPAFDPSELVFELQGDQGAAVFSGCQIEWRRGRWTGSLAGLPRASNVEWFDADAVGSHLRLRHWRAGDRFQPIGLKRSLKVQDWLVNQKVPRAERHRRVFATAATGEIFWIEGLRIGNNHRITPRTRFVLEWRWRRRDFADV